MKLIYNYKNLMIDVSCKDRFIVQVISIVVFGKGLSLRQFYLQTFTSSKLKKKPKVNYFSKFELFVFIFIVSNSDKIDKLREIKGKI